jgi:hypothetical protein
MDTTILGQVRNTSGPANFADSTNSRVQLNNRGDTLIAQSIPTAAELVRLGKSWMAMTATAAAPVTAIPTTAALLGLWNGETGPLGKSYVIDSIFVVQVAVTAAVQNVGILVNNAFSPVLTALANTITPRPLRGLKAYDGLARIAVGITLDVTNGVASNWFPWGSTGPGQNTLQIGTVTDIPVDGKIIVPPGGQLALSALAGAATASSIQIGVRWHEVYLPIA